jgi:hypothetical protein
MPVMQIGHAMAVGTRRCELICNRCTTAKAGRKAISTYSRHIDRKIPLWRTCPEYASTVHAASNVSTMVVARPTERLVMKTILIATARPTGPSSAAELARMPYASGLNDTTRGWGVRLPCTRLTTVM